ncbi:response regulator [bacterium]|nr:response regulator [bacterium]
MAEDKKTILIIEDEVAMLRALVEKFEKEGFNALSAQDGEEGYEVAMKENPDFLIIDIIMPKMDGITLMKKIREDEKWGLEVPIIMLTNLSDPESVSEAAKYKVYDFLVKTDWRLNDVVKLVKERLEL